MWWAHGVDQSELEAKRLDELVNDLERLRAIGRENAGRKWRGRAGPMKTRLYVLFFVAVQAETRVRSLFGATGETHEQIGAAVGMSASASAHWAKTGEAQFMGAEHLLALLGSTAFSPPVRRWLLEQVGMEIGGVIVPDFEHTDREPGEMGLEARMVDVLAAAGACAVSLAEARPGGVDRAEAARLLEISQTVVDRVQRMRAELEEMARDA